MSTIFPAWLRQALKFPNRISTHLIKFAPNPKNPSTLIMYWKEMLSKAFSKSINKRRPVSFFDLAHCIISYLFLIVIGFQLFRNSFGLSPFGIKDIIPTVWELGTVKSFLHQIYDHFVIIWDEVRGIPMRKDFIFGNQNEGIFSPTKYALPIYKILYLENQMQWNAITS